MNLKKEKLKFSPRQPLPVVTMQVQFTKAVRVYAQ